MATLFKEIDAMYFSADLELQSLYHIEFLKIVETKPHLKTPEALDYALYRYERFWLPLAAEYQQRNDKTSRREILSAPLDIEWVWHCHMLSPKAYVKDCCNVVGIVVNHTLKSELDFEFANKTAKAIWTIKYPNEPFDLNSENVFSNIDMRHFNSRISYDIVSASKRQSLFYYQVSLPHFQDEKFLKNSLIRYKKFLFLKTLHPDEFLVPCYDIDLMWHSHQLNPLIYCTDMHRIIGHLFNHNDTVNDRSPGSTLSKSASRTFYHWKTNYSENYAVLGAMYRGIPYPSVLSEFSLFNFRNKILSNEGFKIHVILEEISLHHPELKQTNWKCFSIELSKDLGINDHEQILLKFKRKFTADTNIVTWSNKYSTKVLFGEKSPILSMALHIQKNGVLPFCCTKMSETYTYLNILEVFRNKIIEKVDSPWRALESISIGVGMIKLKMRTQYTPMNHTVKLTLKQGDYKKSRIGSDIQDFLEQVSNQRLPFGKNVQCEIADHT